MTARSAATAAGFVDRPAPAVVLRPYQAECVDALRCPCAAGRRAPLLQLPTGGGKTIIFSEVAHGARAKGRRVLVLVHRRELIPQASAKLAWADVPHGIIANGFAPADDELVQIASVQTIAQRLQSLSDFDLIVVDEAHHAQADTWRTVLAALPAARLLGVTATPARLDGRGLGVAAGGVFDDIVCGPSIRQLIVDGYLSPARCFAPRTRLDLTGVRIREGDYVAGDLAQCLDRPAIAGDAVEQYRRQAGHQAAIAFCITIDHAMRVGAAFRAAGYRSQPVHGKLTAPERDGLIAGLGTGAIEVLTSCELISEGLDVPSVGAVILLRPTKSFVLHAQQIGRGLRPAPGKDALVVLDHAGNVLEHGLPDQEHVWSLSGVEKPPGEAPVWPCPAYGFLNDVCTAQCGNCGEVFARPRPVRATAAVPDQLEEVTNERRLALIRTLSYRMILGMRLSEAELAAYADAHGYKPGWMWHRLRAQREG